MSVDYTPNKIAGTDTIRVLTEKVNSTMDSIKLINAEVKEQEEFTATLTWGKLKTTP